jgi:hypothetical protein
MVRRFTSKADQVTWRKEMKRVLSGRVRQWIEQLKKAEREDFRRAIV